MLRVYRETRYLELGLLDFSNNFWGTTSQVLIEDVTDNVGVQGVTLY